MAAAMTQPNPEDRVSKDQIISIVDDDESLRDAVEDLVVSAGYSVYAFGSAEDFLLSSHCAETSCLITDVQMPGMSGPDLQRHLLAQGRNVPTIFITGIPGQRICDRVTGDGALAVLKKPFSSGDLIAAIGQALDGKKADKTVQ